MRRGHKPILSSLDYQQGTCHLLRHALQVELLQCVERVLCVSGFEPVYHRVAAYLGASIEILGLVVRSAVFNRRLYSMFKCRGTHGEVTPKTHTHQAHAARIHVRSALKVVDGITNRYFVIMTQWILKLHFSLTRPIDRQHPQPSFEKVIAIRV